MNEFNFKSYGNSNQTISYCEVDKCKAVVELKQQLDQLKAENILFRESNINLAKKNEELKKANKHIENNRNQKADKLMRIEKLIIACSTGYTDELIQELLVILHEPEPSSFENKYKTILAEIKEIAEKCIKTNDYTYNPSIQVTARAILGEEILQKISECEGNDDRL